MLVGPMNKADFIECPKPPAEGPSESDSYGVYVEPDGDVVLEPYNRAPNPNLQEMGKDDSPDLYVLHPGIVQQGNLVFMNLPDGPLESQSNRHKLVRQTLAPVPLGINSWIPGGILVEGGRRPQQNEELPRAIMRAVKTEHVGYSGGTRRAATFWIGKRGERTKASERTVFTPAAVTEQFFGLEWTFEDEPPENARWRGLMLTKPDGTELITQDIIPATKRSHVMHGPFRNNGKKEPDRNATKVGRARKPKHGSRHNVAIRADVRDLKPGRYRVRLMEVSPQGPAPQSEWSEVITVERRRKKQSIQVRLTQPHPDTTHFRVFAEFDPSLSGDFAGEAYEVYESHNPETLETGFPRDYTVALFGPEEAPDDTTEAPPDEDDDDPFEALGAGSVGVAGLPTDPTDSNFGGDLQKWIDNAQNWAMKKLRDRDRARGGGRDEDDRRGGGGSRGGNDADDRGSGGGGTERENPEEDYTGVTDPPEPPAPPQVKGFTFPARGHYWGSYAPYFDEEQHGGVPYSSPPDRVITATGELPQLVFPNIANALRNAEFGDEGRTRPGKDAAGRGLPTNWGFPETLNGVPFGAANRGGIGVDLSTPGVMRVRTGSIKGDAAGEGPLITSGWVEINKDDVWVARGVMRIVSKVSGTFRVAVEFLDAGDADDHAGRNRTVIGSLDEQGEVAFSARCGPRYENNRPLPEDNPTNRTFVGVEYPENAVAMRFKFFFLNTGSPVERDLIVEVLDMAFHPLDAVLRKFDFPEPGSGHFADPNPTPNESYLSGNIAVITEPPSKQNYAGGSFTPVQRVTFEATSASPSQGLIPSSWTRYPGTVAGGTLHAVTKAAAIYGDWGWDISNATATVKGPVYIGRSFGSTLMDGKEGAIRVRRRVRQLPTFGDQYGILMERISGNANGTFVDLFLNRWGTIHRRIVDRTGTQSWKVVATGIVDGDVLDYEVVYERAATDNAAVFFYFGKNGQMRRRIDTATSASTRLAGHFLYSFFSGVIDERDARTTWNFDIDEIVITLAGDELAPRNPTPVDVAASLPDRPFREVLPLYEKATGGLTWPDPVAVPTPPERRSMSVKGRWDFGWHAAGSGGAQVAETLAEIRTTAGNPMVRLQAVVTSGAATTRSGLMRVQIFNAAGTLVQTFPVKSALADGARHGAEVVINGAGTAAGTVDAYYVYPDGTREPQVTYQGADWEGVMAGRAVVVNVPTRPAADSRVDRAGEFVISDLDEDREPIKQLYVFKHALVPQRKLGLECLVGTVTPGESFTVGWKVRHAFAGKDPSFPYRYFLQNARGDTIDLGSLYESASYKALSGGVEGARGSSNTPDNKGGWLDLALLVGGNAIPDGFTELWMEPGEIVQGEFVAQEHLFCKGQLGTVRDRDAQRSKRRHRSGRIRVTFPFGLPTEAPSFSKALGAIPLGDPFAKLHRPRNPETNALTARVQKRWRVSQQNPPMAWSDWYASPALMPPGEVGEVEILMFRDTAADDGRSTPVLSPGNVGYEFTHTSTTLCREDGSPLPGGTFVNGFEDAITRPNYNSEEVMGRARHDPITTPITRMERPIEIYFAMPEAYREFLNNAVKRRWRIESPRVGVVYLVRPFAVPAPGGLMNLSDHLFTDEENVARRSAVGIVTLERCEVLEAGRIGE